jgi:hypothetical protein
MALTMNDALGTAVTVGDTVKVVGVIQSLNPLDNRFNELVILLSHPIAGVPDVFIAPGGNALSPGAVRTISVPAALTVKGS